MRIEGSGPSKLTQVIRHISQNSITGITLELATVTAPLPDLKIKVDGMSIELEKNDLVIAEYLTRHSRKVNLVSDGQTTLYSNDVSGQEPKDPPHTPIDVKEVTLANSDLTVNNGEMDYIDELKSGDRVIVAGMSGGQTFVILAKAMIPIP